MLSRLKRKWVPWGLSARFQPSSKENSSTLLYFSVPHIPLLMLMSSASQISAPFMVSRSGKYFLLSTGQEAVAGMSLCVPGAALNHLHICFFHQPGDMRNHLPEGTHSSY